MDMSRVKSGKDVAVVSQRLDATALDAKRSVLHEVVEAGLIVGKVFKDPSNHVFKITRFKVQICMTKQRHTPEK
jgi:hypothetical protein